MMFWRLIVQSPILVRLLGRFLPGRRASAWVWCDDLPCVGHVAEGYVTSPDVVPVKSGTSSYAIAVRGSSTKPGVARQQLPFLAPPRKGSKRRRPQSDSECARSHPQLFFHGKPCMAFRFSGRGAMLRETPASPCASRSSGPLGNSRLELAFARKPPDVARRSDIPRGLPPPRLRLWESAASDSRSAGAKQCFAKPLPPWRLQWGQRQNQAAPFACRPGEGRDPS